jgi:hypothetical protein
MGMQTIRHLAALLILLLVKLDNLSSQGRMLWKKRSHLLQLQQVRLLGHFPCTKKSLEIGMRLSIRKVLILECIALASITSSGSLSATQAPSTSTSATASNSPSPTSGADVNRASCPKNNGDLGTKVGLGVGIPLGVLVAAILGLLGWREYQKFPEKHPSNLAYAQHGTGPTGGSFFAPEHKPPTSVRSPPGYSSYTHAFVEADSGARRQEMPS